ncbi:MAG TPA: hypothetical protein VD791_10015, partial [Burkholderiales bacterium]|nr:hypothetical protein [Burkholderiales bacterium]
EPENTGGSTTPTTPVTGSAGGGDWLRGLLGGGDDPTGFSAHASTVTPKDLDVPNTMSGVPQALIAGAINGPAGHYVKDAGSFAQDLPFGMATDAVNDAIAPYREWDAKAREGAPVAYAIADTVSSAFDPINKVAGVAKLAGAPGSKMRAGVNALTQGGIAMGDSALREYGETGSVEGPDWVSGLVGGTLAAPQSVVAMGAERYAARQSTPQARQLRMEAQQQARLRHAGIEPSSREWAGLDPAKQAEILAELEVHASTQGKGRFELSTTKDMNLAARQAADSAGADKDAAIAALTAAGAEVDPAQIASNVRGNKSQYVPGDPLGDPKRAVLEDMAQGYDDLAAAQPLRPVPSAAPSTPPPTAATPPPLPPSAPPYSPYPMRKPVPPISSWAEMPNAPPWQERSELQPFVEAPASAPPGSAGAPPWQDRVDVQASQAATQPTANPGMRGMGALPPPPLPAGPQDAISALAEAGQAPSWRDRPDLSPFIAEPSAASLPPSAAAPPWQDRIAAPQSSDPAMSAGMQGLGVPAQQIPRYAPQLPPPPLPAGPLAAAPPQGQIMAPPDTGLYAAGGVPPEVDRMGLPFNQADMIRDTAGKNMKTAASGVVVPTPQNEFDRERYAAIMNAMREGGNATDPALTQQWDLSNQQQGLNLDIAGMGHAAANAKPAPIFNFQDNKLSYMLGGLGGAVGGAVGMSPLGLAAGAGAGIAAGRYLQPRMNSLQANWLSRDTAAM